MKRKSNCDQSLLKELLTYREQDLRTTTILVACVADALNLLYRAMDGLCKWFRRVVEGRQIVQESHVCGFQSVTC